MEPFVQKSVTDKGGHHRCRQTAGSLYSIIKGRLSYSPATSDTTSIIPFDKSIPFWRYMYSSPRARNSTRLYIRVASLPLGQRYRRRNNIIVVKWWPSAYTRSISINCIGGGAKSVRSVKRSWRRGKKGEFFPIDTKRLVQLFPVLFCLFFVCCCFASIVPLDLYHAAVSDVRDYWVLWIGAVAAEPVSGHQGVVPLHNRDAARRFQTKFRVWSSPLLFSAQVAKRELGRRDRVQRSNLFPFSLIFLLLSAHRLLLVTCPHSVSSSFHWQNIQLMKRKTKGRYYIPSGSKQSAPGSRNDGRLYIDKEEEEEEEIVQDMDHNDDRRWFCACKTIRKTATRP